MLLNKDLPAPPHRQSRRDLGGVEKPNEKAGILPEPRPFGGKNLVRHHLFDLLAVGDGNTSGKGTEPVTFPGFQEAEE